MSRFALVALASVLLGTLSTPALAASATDTQTTATVCVPQLETLNGKQAALLDLQDAHEAGRLHRHALRTRAFELAVQIETLKADGASAHAIVAVQTRRAKLLSDVESSERLAPVLARQIEALKPDVEAAGRAYFSCVEASLPTS